MSEQAMNIADGLRRTAAIEKKLPVIAREITKYCSKKKAAPDVIPAQKKHVQSLIQQYRDLMKEWTNIKMAIQRANLETTISYKALTLTLAEAILWKGVVNRKEGRSKGGRKEFEKMLLSSFTTETADAELGRLREMLEKSGKATQEDIAAANLIPELIGWDAVDVQEQKQFLMDLELELDAIIDRANITTILKL